MSETPQPQPSSIPSSTPIPSTGLPSTAATPSKKSVSAEVSAARLAQHLRRKRLRADQNGALIAGGIMAGMGWVLLVRLVHTSPPLAFPRWLFFILLFLAVTGTVIPFVWYLNQRLSRYTPATSGVLLRQSMWFGMFAVTAMWLQLTRSLTAPIAFFLALAMGVIEVFLRLRERASSNS